MGEGQRPQLRYLRGTTCAADPHTLQSTQIDFFCRQSAGLGHPVLQEIEHDCHYRFDWATNIICPAFRSQKNDRDCVIHNEQIHRHLSLKDVFSGTTISLKDNVSLKSFRQVFSS
jgi:insulin-like growth factor 2 receptor